MDKKYTLLKSDNLDLKIENKMYTKENSRLNKIIIAQKQVNILETLYYILLRTIYYISDALYIIEKTTMSIDCNLCFYELLDNGRGES